MSRPRNEAREAARSKLRLEARFRSIDKMMRGDSFFRPVCIAFNFWGWSPRGIVQWVRYGWGLFSVWGVEVSNRPPGSPRKYRRRVKIGPLCFGWGSYEQ